MYRFRDPHGRVIYVGKAKNLRSRLNSYFANPAGLLPKTYAMVHTASSVEWTVVGSELESLQLEYTWIKEFKPRFNVMFRDDKSYPYLAVTMGEKYPRVQVLRGERRKGTRYFGPYTAGAIRDTMDTLLRVFPVRSCSAGVLKRAEASGRPCLLGYIDKCAAPCVGRISAEDHRALAEDFCTFMGGEAKPFVTRLEKEMAAAVAELDYERAARIRDDIVALKKVFERNAVVLAEGTDADVFALHEDELEAAVQVFHVRGGRIRGQRGWVVEKVEDSTTPGPGRAPAPAGLRRGSRKPGPAAPGGPGPGGTQQRRRTGRMAQRPPRRPGGYPGPATRRQGRPAVHRPGQRRARPEAPQVPAGRRPDRPVPGAAGTAGGTGPARALMRIECFDISHIQGTNVVGSMVVVEDGLPKKSDYRKFSVSGAAANDDTAAMHDVLTRRFRNYLQEKAAQAEAARQPGHQAAPPR